MAMMSANVQSGLGRAGSSIKIIEQFLASRTNFCVSSECRNELVAEIFAQRQALLSAADQLCVMAVGLAARSSQYFSDFASCLSSG
jgi:hypothetical protein